MAIDWIELWSGKPCSALKSRNDSKETESNTNPKHRLALSLVYGCGLRVGEVAALEIRDLNFERESIHVRNGNGKKDRVTLFPISLREEVRTYLACYKPDTYLFESQPGKALCKRTFQGIFELACAKAGISQEGGIHNLRHSFATHLLESGTDLKPMPFGNSVLPNLNAGFSVGPC